METDKGQVWTDGEEKRVTVHMDRLIAIPIDDAGNCNLGDQMCADDLEAAGWTFLGMAADLYDFDEV